MLFYNFIIFYDQTRLNEALQVGVPGEENKTSYVENEQSTTVEDIELLEDSDTPTVHSLLSASEEEETNLFAEYNSHQELNLNFPTASPAEEEFSYQYTIPNVTYLYPAAEYSPQKEENFTYFSGEYNLPHKLNANISSASYSPPVKAKPIEFFYEYTIPNVTYSNVVPEYASPEKEVVSNLTAEYSLPEQNTFSAYPSNEYNLSQKLNANISTAALDSAKFIEFFYQYTIPNVAYSYPVVEYDLPRDISSAYSSGKYNLPHELNENVSSAVYSPPDDTKLIEISYEYTIPNIAYPYSAAENSPHKHKELGIPIAENSSSKPNIISAYLPAKSDSSQSDKTVNFVQVSAINSTASAEENHVELSYEYEIPVTDFTFSSVEYSPATEVINALAAEYNPPPVVQNKILNKIKPAQNFYKYTIPNILSIDHPAFKHASLKKVEVNVPDNAYGFPKQAVPIEFPYEPKFPDKIPVNTTA